jgi:hypothetical protein
VEGPALKTLIVVLILAAAIANGASGAAVASVRWKSRRLTLPR